MRKVPHRNNSKIQKIVLMNILNLQKILSYLKNIEEKPK